MIVTCCGSTAAVLCQYASGALGWKNNNFLLSELHFCHFYVKGCICIVFLSLRRHDVFNLAVWLLNRVVDAVSETAFAILFVLRLRKARKWASICKLSTKMSKCTCVCHPKHASILEVC